MYNIILYNLCDFVDLYQPLNHCSLEDLETKDIRF